MKSSRLKKSYKSKADLVGSEKLQRYLFKSLTNKEAKQKWKILLKDEPQVVTEVAQRRGNTRNSEGLARIFRLKWVARQSLKEHFKIRTKSQWRQTMDEANKANTGEGRGGDVYTFMALYEKRIDTLLWKSKLAASLEQARQLVSKGFVFQSEFPLQGHEKGWVCARPSERLKVGNWLSIRLTKEGEATLKNGLLQKFKDTQIKRKIPVPWHIEVHYATLALTLADEPTVKKVVYPYNVTTFLML